jgi:radical SAM protein with 4Fe4S-binding SPASM domain
MKAAREVGVEFGISTVVGDFNIEYLQQTVEYLWTEFHPASMGLNLPHNNKEGLWDRIEEYTEALITIFDFAKHNGIFIDQINRRLETFLKQKFRFRDCSSQGEKEVHYPGAQVHHCVNQSGLKNGDEDWSMKIPLYNSQCRDCYAIGICGGGCIFDGEAGYGYGRFDDRNCYFTKNMLEHFIWDTREELGDNCENNQEIEKIYGAMLARNNKLKFSVGHETS